MDPETLERMDRLASRQGLGRANRSRLIRQAVQEYVTRLERAADDEHELEVLRRHRGRLRRQARALVRGQAKD